jgi:hypothetical protein
MGGWMDGIDRRGLIPDGIYFSLELREREREREIESEAGLRLRLETEIVAPMI